MLKKFFTFGEMTARQAITALFYIGLAPLLAMAYAVGKKIYIANTQSQIINYMRNGKPWTEIIPSQNGPLIILGCIAAFVIMTLLWKILCELTLMIFRCFETYVRRNDN